MGTHRLTGLNRLLTVSVAESVPRKAPCPAVRLPATEKVDEGAAVGEEKIGGVATATPQGTAT